MLITAHIKTKNENQFSREIGNVIVGEKIKIKFELDVLPSDYQVFTDLKIRSVFSETIKAHDLATCMGQKIHAVLCRSHFYGIDLIKGRDLYDLEWYLEQGISPNYKNLKECLARWDKNYYSQLVAEKLKN